MADHGIKQQSISFTGSRARAILEGRMTQTRQPVTPQPRPRQGMVNATYCGHPHLWLVEGSIAEGDKHDWRCPYGNPGDQLWVQEPWAVQRAELCLGHERDWQELGFPTVRYLADGATRRFQGNRSTGEGIYKGPVERNLAAARMPRWASRITLEVTGVRVERLQDISEADAAAEGIERVHRRWWLAANDGPSFGSAGAGFRYLWESINGYDSWDANPWVWVVEFKRVEVSHD